MTMDIKPIGIVRVRASALKELMDCPARFEAKHIRHIPMPKSGKAQLGTAIHASTAVYDAARIANDPITPDESAAALVDAIHRPAEPVDWGDDLTPKVAENIGLALHSKYCATIAPRMEYAAVEVTCDALRLPELGLELTGTTDRVRKTESGYGIADIKTGGTAVAADGTVSTQGAAMQMGVYELLAEHGSGLPITEPAKIIGMQTAKTERAQRVAVGTIHAAREMLVGTPDDPGLLELAANIIHRGAFHGNPSSMLCHERYCPIFKTCKYRR